jgi:pyridoxine/pyridoxamine 5'-phosphate oxidase
MEEEVAPVTRAEIYELLRRHRLAVISTVNAEASPQAALIGFAVTEALDIIFDTVTTSRKYANMLANPRVALVIGWDAEQTVQVEGSAEVLSGDALQTCKQEYLPCGRTAASASVGLTSPMSACARAGCATAILARRRRGLRN